MMQKLKKVDCIDSVVTQIASFNTFYFLSIRNHKLFGTFYFRVRYWFLYSVACAGRKE